MSEHLSKRWFDDRKKVDEVWQKPLPDRRDKTIRRSQMKEKLLSYFERIFIKVTSAKTAGFAVATWMLYTGKMSGDNWLIAFGIFCGINIAQKFLPTKKEE